MKQRIDVWLVTRGLAESREKAQALIMAGQVYVGEKKVLKSSEQIAEDAPLQVRGGGQDHFASRGGHKLEKAITAFSADVTGAAPGDLGAALSLGGATLAYAAASVPVTGPASERLSLSAIVPVTAPAVLTAVNNTGAALSYRNAALSVIRLS